MKNNAWYKHIKDVLLYGAIIFVLVFVGITYFDGADKDQIVDLVTQYIGFVVTVLLGFIGIIEFAYDNGLDLLVPTKFEEYKEEKLRQQTKEYLKDFFDAEKTYFDKHSEVRIDHLLKQLGLNHNQFEKLKNQLISIRLMPLHTLEDARAKLRAILKHSNIILTQDGMDTDRLVYKQVKYFINFTDIMFDDDYSNQIAQCLSKLIQEIAKDKLHFYDYVLVSHSGNFLLGKKVSAELRKNFIKITEKPLILHDKSYIGDFDPECRGGSILIHDVLVSGRQLIDSVKKVAAHTKVDAIYCLVNRLDFGAQESLEKELGIPVHSLINLDDAAIEELLR